MKIRFTILILLIPFLSISQEVDTLKLKREVEKLSDISSMKKYLKRIYDEDQKYRGRRANHKLDYEHLISISYFTNKFGYPKKKDYGDVSSVGWLVWKHNNHRALSRISFPIIHKGFMAREINETDLRTYHIYFLYAEKYDDEKYLSMPLKELFEICNVNTNQNIPISDIIETKMSIDSLDEIETVSISTWKSEDISKTYLLNGDSIKRVYTGETFKLIQKVNGKKYIQRVTIDNSSYPQEVLEIDRNKYKYKDQETKKYFEFIPGKMIHRTEKKILKEYNSIGENKG